MKSVLLKGDLRTNSTIDYILTPNTEFSNGKWKICVNYLAYNCDEPNVNEICHLSCNFVRSQKYSVELKETITYEQPFGIFQLESGKKVISLSTSFDFTTN